MPKVHKLLQIGFYLMKRKSKSIKTTEIGVRLRKGMVVIPWDFYKASELNKEILGIIVLTFQLAFCAASISALVGIPFGMLLERTEFHGKKIVIKMNRTLMGLPPVVAGLVVYLLLMRRGLFGNLKLLFTFLATQIKNFAKSMGASRRQTFFLLIREMKNEMYFIIVTGFGRSVSEVGAVMIVGGNIQYQTRTMTTAISLMRSKGDYREAITLGVVLLVIAFIIQCMVDVLRRYEDKYEND
jgi:tungstate transport system permease protein